MRWERGLCANPTFSPAACSLPASSDISPLIRIIFLRNPAQFVNSQHCQEVLALCSTRGRDPQIPSNRDVLCSLGKVHLLPWKQIAAVNNSMKFMESTSINPDDKRAKTYPV